MEKLLFDVVNESKASRHYVPSPVGRVRVGTADKPRSDRIQKNNQSPLTTMHTIWIAYGSNQGDPIAQLLRARQNLATRLDESGASALYRTPPWGYTAQPDFINAVIRYRSDLAPLALLDLLQSVEQQQGRERPFKNAPRTLDLDLLAYDDLHLDHPRLTLPHPGICERAFVLRPLADLNPELRLGGQTVRAHLARCQDANIQPIAHPDWQTATSGDNHAP